MGLTNKMISRSKRKIPSISKSNITLLLVLFASIQSTASFIPNLNRQTSHRSQLPSQNTALYYRPFDGIPKEISLLPLLNMDSEVLYQTKDTLSQLAQSFSSDPDVFGGTVFQNLSHLFDLSMILICPEDTLLIRFALLVGRLFSVLSDYIPDHTLRPEELFFQLCMLGISAVPIFRNIIPSAKVILAQEVDALPKRRDVLAFRNLFEPVGISWIQFRTLFECKALEWVEIEKGDDICLVEDIWLSEGEGSNAGNNLYWVYDSSTRSFEAPDNIGELASLQFLRKIERRRTAVRALSNDQMDSFLHKKDCDRIVTHCVDNPNDDKIFLRMNTEKMIELMEENESLSVSMLFLAVNCLQNKVQAIYD